MKIRTPSLIGRMYYRNLYNFCRTGMTKDCDGPFDLTMQIGFPLKKQKGSSSRSQEIYAKDYVYCRYQSKIIIGNVEIFNLERDDIFVNFNVNLFGRLFFPIDFFNSLIHFIAFRKGLCLLHGASIGVDGKGILLLGATGSGKTHLVTASSKDGFAFINDDFNFLYKGNILSYSPPSLVLKWFHVNRIKAIPWKIKAEMLVKRCIALLTNGYVNLVTPAAIECFFKEKRIERAILNKIYYMSRQGSPEALRVKEKKDLIQAIVLQSKISYPFVAKLSESWAKVDPKSDVSNHWNRFSERLEEEFNGIPWEEKQAPSQLADATIENTLKEMKNAVR